MKARRNTPCTKVCIYFRRKVPDSKIELHKPPAVMNNVTAGVVKKQGFQRD